MLTDLNTKLGIWNTVALGKYPDLTDDQLVTLCLQAGTDWYTHKNTELSYLFEQYHMLAQLTGVTKYDHQ